MAVSPVAAAAAGVVEAPATTVYQRVPCDLPRIGIWLPTTAKDSCGAEVEVQVAAGGDRTKAPASFLNTFRVKMSGACRRAFPGGDRSRSRKVCPTSDSKESTRNSDIELTALEKQYLDYLRRSVGRGDFSHYLMPGA